jgi:ABC-type transporter Mla maintaining outer membrane lipid asymmetry ATPase subunit MlaF
MSQQYIYQIGDLTKKYNQREVLKNIWLAFYPGAKIGVLGRNGSGKSTLCRALLGQLGNNYATALILNPILDADQLMRAIAMEMSRRRGNPREVPNPGTLRIFHLPDHVERVFQLHDDANRGEK